MEWARPSWTESMRGVAVCPCARVCVSLRTDCNIAGAVPGGCPNWLAIEQRLVMPRRCTRTPTYQQQQQQPGSLGAREACLRACARRPDGSRRRRRRRRRCQQQPHARGQPVSDYICPWEAAVADGADVRQQLSLVVAQQRQLRGQQARGHEVGAGALARLEPRPQHGFWRVQQDLWEGGCRGGGGCGGGVGGACKGAHVLARGVACTACWTLRHCCMTGLRGGQVGMLLLAFGCQAVAVATWTGGHASGGPMQARRGGGRRAPHWGAPMLDA